MGHPQKWSFGENWLSLPVGRGPGRGGAEKGRTGDPSRKVLVDAGGCAHGAHKAVLGAVPGWPAAGGGPGEGGGCREPLASLSAPCPALRDPCPAFGCCTLSLQFPSGSFLGATQGGGATIRLGSGLKNTPSWGHSRPGLVRGGQAFFARQGMAPRGHAGVVRGGGGEARAAGHQGPGGWGSPRARTSAGGLPGVGVSNSGRPSGLL